jgi:hypothetical protein
MHYVHQEPKIINRRPATNEAELDEAVYLEDAGAA